MFKPHHPFAPYVLIIALYIASRFMFHLLGLRFDAQPLVGGLQFIDPALLKDKFFESISFYHAGPPMLNLIAGLGLTLPADWENLFYTVLFAMLAVVTLATVFGLVLRLTASNRLAWFAVMLLAMSPSFHLYSNWLMYTFPACALLTLSAWLLMRLLDNPGTTAALAFFGCLALLALTRSLFHLYWVLFTVLVVITILKGHRRSVTTAALLPLLLICLWYGKNLYLFNSFSSSSLLGLSLNNVSTLMLPRDVLQAHIDRGELTRFATVSRYQSLWPLLDDEVLAPETGIEVLDQHRKSTGSRNYNSLEILLVSQAYLSDAITVIKTYPMHYLTAVGVSHQVFFTPASLNVYLSKSNQAATQAINKWLDPLIYGARPVGYRVGQPHFGFTGEWFVPANPGYLLIMLHLFIFVFGIFKAIQTIMSGHWTTENVVIGYLFGCIAMIYLLGTFFELSENNRYRFISEPVFWVMVMVMLDRGWKQLQNLRKFRF